MKKVFFVCDSFHTGKIATAIKSAFIDAEVYTDATILSTCKTSIELTILSGVQKTITEDDLSKNVGIEKVDYFILSGKLISDDSVNVEKLKEQYGTKNSKVIGVSMSIHFLYEIKDKVDVIENKETFFNSESIRSFFSKQAVI